MGKIANAMLSGELCAMCGVPLCKECSDMEIPMYCSEECAKDQLVPKEGRKSRVCDK